MTKMKSRKMTKSTFAIIIMGIAMVAMLAFGCTFAYFTATTQGVSDNATTGIIRLGNNSIGTFTTSVVSGEDVLANGSSVTVTNQSNRGSYIFVTFTVQIGTTEIVSGEEVFTPISSSHDKTNLVAGLLEANEHPVQKDYESLLKSEGDYILDYAVDGNWTLLTGVEYTENPNVDNPGYFDVSGVYVYEASAIANNTPQVITVCDSIKFYGKSESTQTKSNDIVTTTQGSLMNAQIRLTITSKSIQHDGFSNAQRAYSALMGPNYREKQ